MPFMPTPRTLLIILDGFGTAKACPTNGVTSARMPFYRELFAKYPHAQLTTHGEAVGLPAGVMGNSEVGHTNIGAGRIVYQDLTRISKAIRDRDFFSNPVLVQTLEAGAKKTGRVHLMGLLSDGGVHSHIDHLLALLDLCVQLKVPHVSVHPFLDGRDTPPESSLGYIEQLLKHPTFAPSGQHQTRATVATVSGRFWAMDRDKRWDRVQRAYQCMTGQVPAWSGPTKAGQSSLAAAVMQSHAAGKTDEFVEPTLLDSGGTLKDGDSVVFFNFRSDRARELSAVLSEPDFKEFDRGQGFRPSAMCGLTTYDAKLKHVQVAYSPQNLSNIFGEWLEKKGKTQFRTAETEKYAHVTFFFNGGREAPFHGEDRLMVPSPKEVATYDLKPEMSAVKVADGVVQALNDAKHDFVLVNFANADMVGHTGILPAVIQALETLDACLARVIPAALKSGYSVLLTADHGNAEEMVDSEGRPHTQHTLNTVPVLWIAEDAPGKKLRDGELQDLMPTLCKIMGLPLPGEVTGKSLLN